MKKKIAIILPMAGKATRFKALKGYTKQLLPFENKTILEHIVEHFDRYKKNYDLCFHFIFSEDNKDVLTNEVEKFKINCTTHVQSKELPGPLGAIIDAVLVHVDEDEEVLLHLGDIFIDENETLNFDKDMLSIQFVKDFSRWCMVDQTLNFYDKPVLRPNTNTALSGLYFFKNTNALKKILHEIAEKHIHSTTEIQISELLKRYVKNGNKFVLKPIRIHDCGDIEDYLKLTKFRKERSHNKVVIDEKQKVVSKFSDDIKVMKESLHQKTLYQLTSLDNDEDGLIKVIYSNPVESSDPSYAFEVQMPYISGEVLDRKFVFDDCILEKFELIFSKVLLRLKNQMCSQSKLIKCNDLYEVLASRNIYNLSEYVDMLDLIGVVTHGDYHLGNMLLTAKNDVLTFDVSGRILHPRCYDLAKLMHGVIYNYHVVKFGLYKYDEDINLVKFYNIHLKDRINIFKHLLSKTFNKKELEDAKIICMILFKTMQQFHTDDNDDNKVFELIHTQLQKEIDNDDFSLNTYEEIQ